MAADNGDITAVVACFNYGAYLGEMVGSLLGQVGGAPRVVVVDDGSDDLDTIAALDALPDGVELVRQPNRGVGAARNAGLLAVRILATADQALHAKMTAFQQDLYEQAKAKGARLRGLTSS